MPSSSSFAPGAGELASRAALLADRLSGSLKLLAPVAYNYVWSWMRDGASVFRDVDPYRWELSGKNPVRFLDDLSPSIQEAVARDLRLVERIESLADEISTYLERPPAPRPGIAGPVAFFCAEYAVHGSLPIYSGGLGVLAGDILKEASDQALPMIGLGLFYRRGYFRQRVDRAGRQQECWPEIDAEGLPMARVATADGTLRHVVKLYGRPLAFQVWRVDVGRVPLLLLDADVPENDGVQRWTTARLYDGNRTIRLAQYGLLGLGGAAVLGSLGVQPAIIHLNEGHPALAPLELAAGQVESGADLADALATIRRRVVFTTHTPVPAGNETYAREEFLSAFADLPRRLGIDDESFLGLARIDPDDRDEPPGMTPLALRTSGRRNGVSRLHGEVSRTMWRPLFGASSPADVPIGHVTNGAHLPTFLAEPMRRLLARYLGKDWALRAADTSVWEGVREIPDGELWSARCEARERLVRFVREKTEQDRLLRGEEIEDARALERWLEPDVLTLGFARRLATYKRLNLLAHDQRRARRILGGSRAVQLLIAGKAHPSDEDGKDTLQRLLRLRLAAGDVGQRVVFVEDYDLDVAGYLVSGCDVWVNLPRRPMEASGTSGMKATFNGVLQLSVLDGWWAEAYDGTNGWAIPGDENPDFDAADRNDGRRFYDLLENEVIPLFYEHGADGVPHGWCARVKEALVTCAPAFTATRMVNDYVGRMYAER